MYHSHPILSLFFFAWALTSRCYEHVTVNVTVPYYHLSSEWSLISIEYVGKAARQIPLSLVYPHFYLLRENQQAYVITTAYLYLHWCSMQFALPELSTDFENKEIVIGIINDAGHPSVFLPFNRLLSLDGFGVDLSLSICLHFSLYLRSFFSCTASSSLLSIYSSFSNFGIIDPILDSN